MSHSLTLHGVKFTRLIGDEKTFRHAEALSKQLHENNLVGSVKSIEMTNEETHIVTSDNRVKVMEIARAVIADSEITCL